MLDFHSAACFATNVIVSTQPVPFPQVLTKQFLALVEMQNNPRNFSKIAQVVQRDRVVGLQVQYANINVSWNVGPNYVVRAHERCAYHCPVYIVHQSLHSAVYVDPSPIDPGVPCSLVTKLFLVAEPQQITQGGTHT